MRLTRILLGGVLLVETRFGLVVGYVIRPCCNTITRPGTSRLVYGGEVSQMVVVAGTLVILILTWLILLIGSLLDCSCFRCYFFCRNAVIFNFGAGDNNKDVDSELTAAVPSQYVAKGAANCLEA